MQTEKSPQPSTPRWALDRKAPERGLHYLGGPLGYFIFSPIWA